LYELIKERYSTESHTNNLNIPHVKQSNLHVIQKDHTPNDSTSIRKKVKEATHELNKMLVPLLKEQEKYHTELTKYISDKKSYLKIRRDINDINEDNNEDINEDGNNDNSMVPDVFQLAYSIFDFMDENGLLENENVNIYAGTTSNRQINTDSLINIEKYDEQIEIENKLYQIFYYVFSLFFKKKMRMYNENPLSNNQDSETISKISEDKLYGIVEDLLEYLKNNNEDINVQGLCLEYMIDNIDEDYPVPEVLREIQNSKSEKVKILENNCQHFSRK